MRKKWVSKAGTNLIGMRLHRRGTGRSPTTQKYTSPEDRELRLVFQRRVASSVCCTAAYMMEAVTLSDRIAREAGLPTKCPRNCESYVALWRATFEDKGIDPDLLKLTPNIAFIWGTRR